MKQQIKTFLAIAEHKSISDAARVLHYTQPTISIYLNQLEKKLGVQLVHRTRGKREISLTPDGEAFLPLAQRYADIDMRITHFIESKRHKILRFAASSHSHEHIVSEIAHKLMQLQPETEIRLSTVENREMEQAVADQTFDVALMYGPLSDMPNVVCTPLFYEERYILCRTDSPLPQGTISPRDLDPSFEVLYTGYISSTVPAWREQHFPEMPEPFFRVSSISTVHNYMTDYRNWAPVPACIAIKLAALYPDQLSYRRITPAPPPRLCNLLVAKSYSDDQTIQKLLQCLDTYTEMRPYLKKVPR